MRRATLLLAVVIGLGASACSNDGYEIRVTFESDVDRDATELVQIFVTPVSCPEATGLAPADPVERFELSRDQTRIEPLRSFAPGSYGLYARALDGDCHVIATRCEQVDLETDGSGVLALGLMTLMPRVSAEEGLPCIDTDMRLGPSGGPGLCNGAPATTCCGFCWDEARPGCNRIAGQECGGEICSPSCHPLRDDAGVMSL